MLKTNKIQLFFYLIGLTLALTYSSVSCATNSAITSPFIRFQHLTIKDGLPQNSVFSIVQDSTGFLWFGTYGGLVRYDGNNLKVFKHEVDHLNSISSNTIKTIIEDSQGNLWIGTRGGGLNHFNTKNEQFTHYRHQANDPNSLSDNAVGSIIEDNQGDLWIGTFGGGLTHFDTKSDLFTHYRHQANDPNSLSHDDVRSIVEDNQGYLWIGTNGGGLNLFNPKTKQFSHYRHQVSDPNSLSHDDVMSITKDNLGNLWIGTLGGGLNYFNQTTAQFSHYRHQIANSNSLSDNNVINVIEDSKNNLWIGTSGGGLNYFDTLTKQFNHYRHQAVDSDSLSSNNILSIFEDDQGTTWVGTFGGGLNHFNSRTIKFGFVHHQASDPNSLSDTPIMKFIEDRRGDMWFGTHGGGVNRLSAKTARFTHYRHQINQTNSLSHDEVWALLEDSSGNIWIGTRGAGLNHFNIKNQQFTLYRHQANGSNSLTHDDIRVIVEDSKGHIWIGTYGGGLNRFDPNTKVFTEYRHKVNDLNSLSHDVVTSIVEDKQGNLWLGTSNGGLNRFDLKTEQFTHYRHQANNSNSLGDDSVISLLEGKQNKLWIGTASGLNVFDKQTEIFKRYSEQPGLPNDFINSLEEDAQGYIWVSTNHGLSRFDPISESFKNYDVGDGLQSNEFNGGASFKSKSGELFFGGIKGFNRFYPDKITDDIQPAKVVITDMRLLNKSVPIVPTINQMTETQVTSADTRFNLAQVIHRTKAISLTHQDNIIAFEFSALHFINPKKNQYAYQLVGWDKNWVTTEYKNRRATYTNLPDGDYTFRVKASNADGYWNEEGAFLQITVLPPPWKTWWAYTLYGLFLLSLVFIFIRSQQQKVFFERYLNAQLETKVIERTLALQTANDQLEELSLTDQLTGLKNRRFLVNNLQSDVALILRKHTENKLNNLPVALNEADLIFYLIDLDHFKQVNDMHGHGAGDLVLIQIKSILESVFRETDYLVRWGGEEFLIIARFTDRSSASELAERLRVAVEQHSFDIGQGNFITKTCSIGYASYPFLIDQPECLDWDRVVDIADHCLYAAKKSNRNAWVGLENINCLEKNIFVNITEKTQQLVDVKQLEVMSSIAEKSRLKWD